MPARLDGAQAGGTHQGHVVGYLALLIALGGTSYAAIRLPSTSVGGKQRRANALMSGR
jgi:hypothetical protein